MKQTIVLSAILLVLIISSFIIKIPYNINCSGKIIPSREWIVRNVDGGDIISIYNDHKSKPIYNYIEFKFERGDIAHLVFTDGYASNFRIKKGDTLGYITSYLLEERLTQLNGLLNEEKAYRLAINSGEKKSLIDGAKNQLDLATQEFEIQAKDFERKKTLFEKQLIPAAEYEISLKAYQLAKANIERAKSNQMTVLTGEKPEMINYSNAKINSVFDEIKLLDLKKKKYSLVAPFDGMIVTKKVALNDPEASMYNMLHVVDTTEYIVLLPVELYQMKYIKENIKFKVYLSSDNRMIEGDYIGKTQEVELTGSFKQVFVLKGSIKPKDISVPYGIFASCTINCGKVSLFEYIKRKIKA